MQVLESTDMESDEMADLDEDGAEQLFQYIASALEDGTEEGDSDVPFTPELEEPVDDSGTGGVETITRQEHVSEEDHRFERHISFSYELEQGAEEVTPDLIQIIDPNAYSTGMPGFNWVDRGTSGNYDEETGEVEFYTNGEWEIHFLYKGEEVHFTVLDDWFMTLDPQGILDDVPAVW